jgi:hypothetical protein
MHSECESAIRSWFLMWFGYSLWNTNANFVGFFSSKYCGEGGASLKLILVQNVGGIVWDHPKNYQKAHMFLDDVYDYT